MAKWGEDEYGRWYWDGHEKVAVEPYPFGIRYVGLWAIWYKLIARYYIVRWHLARNKCYDREYTDGF